MDSGSDTWQQWTSGVIFEVVVCSTTIPHNEKHQPHCYIRINYPAPFHSVSLQLHVTRGQEKAISVVAFIWDLLQLMFLVILFLSPEVKHFLHTSQSSTKTAHRKSKYK